MRPRLTLTRLFLLALIGLTGLLGLLFHLFDDGSRQSIVESSERLREAHSRRIAGEVEGHLNEAQLAIENIEKQIEHDVCRTDHPGAIESCLYAQVLNDSNLAEATLTHGSSTGHDADGAISLAPGERWQVSVFRASAATDAPIGIRTTVREGAGFVSDVKVAGSSTAPSMEAAEDPTRHLTFSTPAAEPHYGTIIWSDLSYTQLDARLPEQQRRVVVTVMKAIEDRNGHFLGVLRVGLLTEKIDEMIRKESAESSPHRIFICDDEGRLITRIEPGDHLREQKDEELRVAPTRLPPEVGQALHQPALGQVSANQLNAFGELVAGGQPFFVSFRGLPRTQGWRVGIVVPQSFYFGKLEVIRDHLIAEFLLLIAVILLGGSATLRAIRRGLRQIESETGKMRRFQFSASNAESPFLDVNAVLESLEQAKTAVRAMGKYVPIDLVRQLYESNSEPVLGGELIDVSLMFTDIKEFTNLAERLSPDDLARVLGKYLEVMTGAIQANGGTVDKYIGDAVMVIWNAPAACPDHAVKACRAALACVEATAVLFDSKEWSDKPRLVTRFGLHRDEVLVGHFGAPDRMSFTAIGDGVNLAARLEGLNKQYGTTILVSESIYAAASSTFDFRLLDRVAVKGKSQGIAVYELLGLAGAAGPRVETARAYEKALHSYFERDFAGALTALEGQPHDGPSAVLAARCRSMVANPPPADWNGIYVASIK